MSWLDTLEDIRKKDFSTIPEKERDEAARDVVNMASYACAVVSVSPIPFSDAVLMLPVQSAMVMTIGHIYGRSLTKAGATDLVLELATTAGLGLVARQGIKALLPVVGALLTVPAAFAANWAMGRLAIEYFRTPGATREQLKKVYQAAQKEGGSLFSRERFESFRKARGAQAEEEEDDEAPEAEEAVEAEETEETEPVAQPAGEDGEAAPAVKRVKKVKVKVFKKKKKKRSAAARIIEVDFAERLSRHHDVRRAIDGIIHIELSGDGGGTWTADLTKDEQFITRGLFGSPRLTVRCTAADFIGLMQGTKSAQMAVLSGDLVLEPMDLELAMKLGPLFRS